MKFTIAKGLFAFAFMIQYAHAGSGLSLLNCSNLGLSNHATIQIQDISGNDDHSSLIEVREILQEGKSFSVSYVSHLDWDKRSIPLADWYGYQRLLQEVIVPGKNGPKSGWIMIIRDECTRIEFDIQCTEHS